MQEPTPDIAEPPGQRPLPVLIALAPFILLLELSLASGGAASTASRVLAHVQLGEAVAFFGLSPIFTLHATGLLVVLILLAWHALTGRSWRVRWKEPPQLVFEGLIAAAPLLAGAAFLGSISETTLTSPILEPASARDALAIAIGAGLSEELVFRMLGVSVIYWAMKHVIGLTHWQAVAIAVIATAAAFTLYHGPAALTATTNSFIVVAGCYLGVLYVLRGFAVVVIAHAGYDAVVLIGQLNT